MQKIASVLGTSGLVLTIDLITKSGVLLTKQGGKRDYPRPPDLIAHRPLVTSQLNIDIIQPRACWRPLGFARHAGSCAEVPDQKLRAPSLPSAATLHRSPLCVLLFLRKEPQSLQTWTAV